MSGRVILVDDDDAFLYALDRVLVIAGCRVAAFASASEAWDDLKSVRRPSILVSDIRFRSGDTNGLALGRHARAYHPNLPLIFVTAYPELAQIANEERECRVVYKPCDLDELTKLVMDMGGGLPPAI